jgi:two-component system, sensor histidine kinase and response regulator
VSVAEPLVQAGLLGEAIDRAPDAVFLADESMQHLAVNQAACSMLGYTREELLSLRMTEIATYPEPTGGYDDVMAHVMAHGSRTGTAMLRAKDGHQVEVTYRAHETKLAGMTVYLTVVWPDEAD